MAARFWKEVAAEGSSLTDQLVGLAGEVTELIRNNKVPEAQAKLEPILKATPGDPLLLHLQTTVLIEAGRFKEAEQFAEQALQSSSLRPAARSMILHQQVTALTKQDDLARVRQKVREVLSGPESPQDKIAFLDQVACLPILEGKKEFLPEAMDLAKHALKVAPNDLTLQGTYGALLCEQGIMTEAAEILRAVYNKSESVVDQGISAFYLALIEKQKGNHKRAGRFAKQARELHAEPWLLERLRNELGEVGAAPKCDGCGADAAPGCPLKPERIPLMRTRNYCPRCHDKFVLKVYKYLALGQLFTGVFGATLLLGKNTAGYSWLNLFLVQAFGFLCTIPHELGHAWAGKACGWRVRRIYIGYGKSLFSRRFLGFDWEFRSIPMGGLVFFEPDSENYSRFKHFIAIAAGPLVNAVLGLGAFAAGGADIGTLLSFGGTLKPVQMFCLANLIVLIENLWPHEADTPSGTLPSDGKQLFQILFRKSPLPTRTGNTGDQ